MATYSIGDLSRREILRMSAILGVTSVVSTKFAFARAALHRTPGQILGPFYPVKPFDQNADLTKVPGRPGRAEGEILNVMGRVLNLKGEPVGNSKVEVWQANAHGRYTHPSDTNPAPLDPNFEGSAALTTDSEGRLVGAQSVPLRLVNLPDARGGGPDIFVVTLPTRIIVRVAPSVHDRFAVLTRETVGLRLVTRRLDRAVTSATFRAGKEYNEVARHHQAHRKTAALMENGTGPPSWGRPRPLSAIG
jgi:protocatechuate 3,4-dioxygenase beta subunit